MGVIQDSPNFEESVYLIQESDPVLGGEDGTVNIQPKQLANRTAALKQMFETEHSPSGEHVVTDSMVSAYAAISEAKLDLNFSTASLLLGASENSRLVDDIEAQVNNIVGDDGTAVGALGRAIPLTWQYSEYGFEFELFSQSINLRSITPIELFGTVAGDESVDCASTAKLLVGDYYVIYDQNLENPEVIKVSEILTGNRFRCAQSLTHTKTSGFISQTSWNIKAGLALATSGSVFISKSIDLFSDYSNGKIVIRRDTSSAYLLLQWKGTDNIWVDCEYIRTVNRETGYKDDEFKTPGGPGCLKITVLGASESSPLHIDSMVLFPYSTSRVVDEIIKPECITPIYEADGVSINDELVGSAYRSLYGESQKSAEFQISEYSDFSTLKFQTTVLAPVDSTVTKFTLTSESIAVDKLYYWRVRYIDKVDNVSAWSTPSAFYTSEAFIRVITPTLLSPTSGTVVDLNAPISLVGNTFSVSLGTASHYASVWQISDKSDFSTLLFDSGESLTSLTTFSVTNTTPYVEGTEYFARVKYIGKDGANTQYTSQWSAVAGFTGLTYPVVVAPSVITPYQNSEVALGGSLVASSSTFIMAIGAGTHKSSRWQISSNSSFSSNVYDSTDSTTSKTSLVVSNTGIFTANTTYYMRVRHTASTTGGDIVSSWSATRTFKAVNPVAVIATPSITSPSNGSTAFTGANVTFSSSAFSMTQGTGSHTASEWQISTDPSFTNVVLTSGLSTTNLRSWTAKMPSFPSRYYVRVRYKDNN